MAILHAKHRKSTRRSLLILALVGVLASIGGCAKTATAPLKETALEKSTDFETLTDTDGRIRSYQVVDLSLGETAPVLIILHGFGSSAQQMRTYMETRDTAKRIHELKPVIVYPDGSPQGIPLGWNTWPLINLEKADLSLADDVAFIDQLTDEIDKKYNVDTSKIWVAGWSNGGMMAYRLACELSEKIDAVVIGAGALTTEPCAPTRPVDALHIHGKLDNIVPYEGGGGNGVLFPSTQTSVQTYAKANLCKSGGSISFEGITTLTHTCPENTDIELVTSDAWTHIWVSQWTELLVEFLLRR